LSFEVVSEEKRDGDGDGKGKETESDRGEIVFKGSSPFT